MMSDTMLLGVLRMPLDTTDDLTMEQFISRARQAADRIEELDAHNRRLERRVAMQSEVLTGLAAMLKRDFYLDKPTHDAICKAIEGDLNDETDT